jgi:hypothetical protein
MSVVQCGRRGPRLAIQRVRRGKPPGCGTRHSWRALRLSADQEGREVRTSRRLRWRHMSFFS